MSDNNEASQTSTPTVPKERLDEVLGRARALEQQLQFVQAQVQYMTQNQTKPASPTDPEMERLKEENPTLYRKILKQEQEAKQMRAAFFGIADEQDRTKFLLHFGDKGKKRLEEVERILEQERQRGNVQANRGSIFQYILGAEKLNEELAPKKTVAAPAQEVATPGDVPGSDPQLATVKNSTAIPDYSQLSREDRLAKLSDVEF